MKNERDSVMRTDPLYEKDAYLKSFKATVLSCREVQIERNGERVNCYAIGLDATAFFSEGGGQPADCGTVEGKVVLDVQKCDGEILHYLEEPLELGSSVQGEVDFTIRYSRMQNHTGEHLICGLVHRMYGFENVGFHLTDEEVTVDIDGFLTKEQLCEIQRLANEAIYENVPITVSLPSTKQIKTMEFRSKLDVEQNLRVVIIQGYDACACCAPHVASTGEIGVIKILDSMPHRGGTRFTMICGRKAMEDYEILHANTAKIMQLFSAKRYEIAEGAARIYDQLLGQKALVTKLKKEVARLQIEKMTERINQPGLDTKQPLLLFEEELEEVQLRALLNEGVKKCEGMVGGFVGNDKEGYRYVISKGTSGVMMPLPQLAKRMNEALNGRGGGSDKMIQGSIKCTRVQIEAFMKEEL